MDDSKTNSRLQKILLAQKKRRTIFKRNIAVAIKDTTSSIKRSKFLKKIMLPAILIALFIFRMIVANTATDTVINNLNISLAFIGILLTIISVDDGRRLQEANFLVELNKSFVENEIYTNVYIHLENKLYKRNVKQKPLEPHEVSQYLTFFETLYILVREQAVTIDEFDDLFGYRFFLVINDDEIWDLKLHNHDNFINIYELENRWFNFRVDRGIPILGKTYEIGDKSLLQTRLEQNGK